jgi:hypothetical protein
LVLELVVWSANARDRKAAKLASWLVLAASLDGELDY